MMERLLQTFAEHASLADEDATFPVGNLAALRETNFMSFMVPKLHGGHGATLQEYVETASAFGGSCLSTGMIWVMHCQQVDAIARHAPGELRSELLKRIVQEQLYIASVTTTPGQRGSRILVADSPLFIDESSVTFRRDAPIVTGANHADAFLITLRSGADASEQDVALLFAERTDLTLTTTSTWDAVGMRATESVGVSIEGTVSPRNIIGSGKAFATLVTDSIIPMAHLGWSACWLGAARKRFSELIAWLREPGRSTGPDLRSELVRERLARIRIDLEGANALLMTIVKQVETVRADGYPASDAAYRIQLNALKIMASETAFRTVDAMVGLAGMKLGYCRPSSIPLERTWRDLRSAALNISNDRLLSETGGLVLMDRDVQLVASTTRPVASSLSSEPTV